MKDEGGELRSASVARGATELDRRGTLFGGRCPMLRTFYEKSVPSLALMLTSLLGCASTRGVNPDMYLERACARAGWEKVTFNVDGLERLVYWKGPGDPWKNGAIIVLHGGGGGAANHFCAGRRIVEPQIRFAKRAIESGFAVFALEATIDVVTDSAGRICGKRFDFSVLNRPNVDLPYIQHVLKLIPSRRPPASNEAIFMTGLSTGGYMTIRAATHFEDKITAFAPVSAGDPYGTDTNCDIKLSRRTSAKGILVDRETRKQIIELDACRANAYPRESAWENAGARSRKPAFKQFHSEDDGIVDLSCMLKARTMLQRHGYRDAGALVLRSTGKRSMYHHLWLDQYNQPILDFFASEAANRRR